MICPGGAAFCLRYAARNQKTPEIARMEIRVHRSRQQMQPARTHVELLILQAFHAAKPLNARLSLWLPLKDSNLEQQSQNLLCYHYTKG